MLQKRDRPVKLCAITVTIANGGSLSAEVDLGGMSLVGLIMPAAWTAAALTVQAAAPNSATFNNLYTDGGTEVSLTVDASRFVRLIPEQWAAIGRLKVRSGTAATPVNQAAERTITLLARPHGE